MNWWHGSSRPMRDCRKSRQPQNLDTTGFGRGPPRAGSGRNPDPGTQTPGTTVSSALPATEVLVVADCWQAEPDAEAVIHRAIAAAADIADADVGDAELAIMLTDDAGIRTLNNNWRSIDKP